MPYFPIFVNLEGKEILVVGAGDVAFRKIKALLPFNPKITVIAQKASKNVQEFFESKKIDLKIKQFEESDIESPFFVIGVVDDIDLQKNIFQICSKKKIFVNNVDSPEFCSFIFGSIINEGDLVIGINTSAKAPAVSKALKNYVRKHLPKNLKELIKNIDKLRKTDINKMKLTIKEFFKND